MKDEIMKIFAKDIMSDFKDVLVVGLEEESERFPYSIACINFIYELKEKGINVNMNYFSECVRENIYNEVKSYLER